MSGLLGAIALLTRIPVTAQARDSNELARAVPWFPVVGAGIGVLIALLYALCSMFLPPFLAATLAVTTGVLVTGAFHEDGLADVVDAFAGGFTRERRLEILSDSRLGTFGVLALISSMLVRVGAISALDHPSAVALIPAAHALSRAAGIVLMRRLPLARSDGLGATYAAAVTRGGEAVGVGVGIVLCAGLIGRWSIPALVATALVAIGMGAVARAKIGGIAGDVLGATQQVAELAILVIGVAVMHEHWGALAWWYA